MADLPPRPDPEELRGRAEVLLRAAEAGDAEAAARLAAVGGHRTLAAARGAVAREHGFESWAALEREVERRAILDSADVARLSALLAEEPALTTSRMEHWCDHPKGASPLGYVAMQRYDTSTGTWRDVEGTAEVARVLLTAGAPVDGAPGEQETPLITAASYGDVAVTRVLIEAGADLDARAADDSGGVPGGTALLHAAVFGMTEVVDVLVAAGAEVRSLEEAAAAGSVGGWLEGAAPDARIRALVMAADHQRLAVIDALVAAGTPVDAVDPVFGGHPLRTAAANGRPASVRRLLAHGADPRLADEHGRTPLELCRAGSSPGHEQAEAILAPLAEGG